MEVGASPISAISTTQAPNYSLLSHGQGHKYGYPENQEPRNTSMLQADNYETSRVRGNPTSCPTICCSTTVRIEGSRRKEHIRRLVPPTESRCPGPMRSCCGDKKLYELFVELGCPTKHRIGCARAESAEKGTVGSFDQHQLREIDS